MSIDEKITPLEIYVACVGALRPELNQLLGVEVASKLSTELDQIFSNCTDATSLREAIKQSTRCIHAYPPAGTRFDELAQSYIENIRLMGEVVITFTPILGESTDIETGIGMRKQCSKYPEKHGVVRYLFRGQRCQACNAELVPIKENEKTKPKKHK